MNLTLEAMEAMLKAFDASIEHTLEAMEAMLKAFDASIEHWEFMVQVRPENGDLITSLYCALCKESKRLCERPGASCGRLRHCEICPLVTHGGADWFCNNTPWPRARAALEQVLEGAAPEVVWIGAAECEVQYLQGVRRIYAEAVENERKRFSLDSKTITN